MHDESDERFHALIEHIQVGIVVHRADGTVEVTNLRAQEMLDFTVENPFDRVGPAGQELFIRENGVPFRREELPSFVALCTGTSVRDTLVGAVRPSRGDLRWLLVDAEPQRRNDGTLTHVVTTFVDVTERQILRSKEKFQAGLLDAVGQAVVVTDPAGTITYWNRAAEAMYGWRADEVLGQNASLLVPPGESTVQGEVVLSGVRAGEHWSGVFPVQRKDRTVLPVLVSDTPVYDASGNLTAIIGVATDMTTLVHLEADLARAHERSVTILETITEGFTQVDREWRIMLVNRRAATFLQRAQEDLVGQVLWDVFPGTVGTRFEEELRRSMADGSPREFESYSTQYGIWFQAHVYPTAEGLSVYVRDISERHAYEARLHHQANHDALTGLPNRVLFEDRLHQALLQAQHERHSVAVLLVDLDRFTEINDTLGHPVGDQLLRLIGNQFVQALRDTDTVARFAGDEFVILLPGTDVVGAEAAARLLLEGLEQPFTIDTHTIYVGASVGITTTPDQPVEVVTMLRRADVAMYAAKRTGGYHVYRPEEDPHSEERLALIAGLRLAQGRDELELHYQPQRDLHSGRVEVAEALLRWNHPERKTVPPGVFIPLAEHTGLIRPMTTWVLDEALRQVRVWHGEGLNLRVSVNVSAWSLRDMEIVTTVRSALERRAVDPGFLILEITESALMTDQERSLEVARALTDLGVSITIDDFGTGYSSLSYLDRLPARELKIDPSLVVDLLEHAGHRRIVQAMIDLAHDLGLAVVAEGVENQQTMDLLRAYGSDRIQGYYIARPLPATALTEWLRSHGGIPGSPTPC